ncbi:MAG: permease prefix domain 1-containing protein [Deinococcota bacterium]|nr:permease prefix domain 1-containing protein [Deinococcota bacterium]
MKTVVDLYISKATQGLPYRQRVDTAAELRVHLNNRVKELMLEGFNEEEAEHLAVEQMGPPEPVNRRFLGHVFTVPLGWTVLAVLLIALSVWWGSQNLFVPPEVIKPVETSDPSIASIGTFLSATVTLPREIRTIHGRLVQGEMPDGSSMTSLPISDETYRGKSGTYRMTLRATFSIPRYVSRNCSGDDLFSIYMGLDYGMIVTDDGVMSGGGGVWTCHSPVDNEVGQTVQSLIAPERSDGHVRYKETELDTWTPLWVYQPSVLNESEDASRLVAPEDWLFFYLWLGSKAVEVEDIPPPPSIASLRQRYSWLFTQYDYEQSEVSLRAGEE